MTRAISATTVRLVGVAVGLLFVFATWGCLRVTDQELWQGGAPGPLPLAITRGLLLLLAAMAAMVGTVVALACVRAQWLRRLGVAGLAATLAVLSLEAVFMFVPRSHNVGYTLASRIWFDRYWHPINSLGFRDPEPVRVAGKRLVLAIGDSFTAGAGLRSTRERFSDRLAALREDLQVMNLGRNGADSGGELVRLRGFAQRPDVILLQYYPNDIEGAAQRAGLQMPTFAPYEDLSSVRLRFLVRASYLANFAYWQFPHGDGLAYMRFLEQAMADPEVVSLHHADLRGFVEHARECRAQLVVVVFPLLQDPACTQNLTRGVAERFAAAGAKVIDVADLVADLPVGQRTVNCCDAHASALVNERVAAALAAAIPR